MPLCATLPKARSDLFQMVTECTPLFTRLRTPCQIFIFDFWEW